MRRVSLLTAASAGVSIGVLVAAGLVASVVTGRPAVAPIMVGAALFAALGLSTGWRPALGASTVLALVAGLTLTGQPTPWVSLSLVAGATAISHEAGRISIDLRRPARLGPGVMARLGWRTAAVVGAGPVAAVVGAGLTGRAVPGWLVPVALVLAAVPVALPGGLARGGGGAGLIRGGGTGSGGGGASGSGGGRRGGRRGGRGSGRGSGGARSPAVAPVAGTVVATGLAAIVLGAALLGATARQGIESSPSFGGPSSRAVTDDAEPDMATATTIPDEGDDRPVRPSGGGLVNLVLVLLAAAVVLMLVAGLRRNQIPLETEPVDLGPDDPGLDMIAPTGALLDDEAFILDDDVAAAIVTEISVDLRSEPDPGRAVRYAYARVELRLAGQGIERRQAETEPEFLVRALGILGDDGGALADLTALFERARFSCAPVPEAMRGDALAALERLRARLEPTR